MRRKRIVVLSVLAVCFWTGFARAEVAPTPDRFAYGMPLQLEGSGAFYRVRLPLEVYRGLTRNDLGDICVFNARSEAVPFMVRRPDASPAQAEPGTALHFFPILGDPNASPDGISLRIQKDASGSIIDVSTKEAKEGAGSERKVVAYLVDAGTVQRPIRAFDLDWEAVTENFVGKVSVEGSDDLEHWYSLVRSATVASLHYGDHSLARRTVSFGPVRSKYFRLSWPAGQRPLALKGLAAELSQEATELPRQWLTLSAIPSGGGKPGAYYFDTGGLMPVDRLRVHLPQRNGVAALSLHSRSSEKDEWHRRAATVAYNITVDGEQITNHDISLTPVSDRYWMITFEDSSNGMGDGVPDLEVGWTPQELVFVASGDGPFMLAYGSARVEPRRSQLGVVLSTLSGEQKDKTLILPAQTGPRIILGGESVLQPPPSSLPWKQYVLWAVLGFGVLLLAWMALHLYRQIEKQERA